MCTVVIGVKGDGRFWVAANRDESLVRPATPPRRWPNEGFVAPRDEVGGGTWLGLNEKSLFVGITNRFGANNDPLRESRGHLVVDALRFANAAELHTAMGGVQPSRFNAFHLVYTDGLGCYVTWSDGKELQQEALGPGLHLVTERSYGAVPMLRTAGTLNREPERVRFLRARLDELGPAPEAEALQKLLAIHRPEAPLDSPCVHLPDFGYGTRSSLVLLKAPRVEDAEWRWAEGPPDVTPFTVQRFDTLLHPAPGAP
jgi:uncharacterized protein with NRDE domain